MEVRTEILDCMDYFANTYNEGPDPKSDQFDLQLTHWQMGFLMGLMNRKIVEIQNAKEVEV